MRTRLKLLAILATTALTISPLVSSVAQAQSTDWPNKPIRIVVGFPPGTAPDIFARLYGDYVSKKLNTAVIIDNKPGAATNLATDLVAKAPADGYTFLYALSTAFTLNPFLYTKLPYNPDKDLVPVATTMRQGLVLMAPTKFAPNTPKELIDAAKARPNTITHGSYGAGSPSHLIAEWFKEEAKIEMTHVPYRTNPMSDLVGGQIDTLMEPISTGVPMITSGRAKAIAYSGPTRHPSLPNVPTFAESIPNLSVMSWHGIWAPSATPANIVTRFHAAMLEASRDAGVQAKIKELNVEVLGLSREDMTALVRRDAALFSRIAKAQNITLD
jgi:tripartite-type tricarboxylate transporter receptor subunit TctC